MVSLLHTLLPVLGYTLTPSWRAAGQGCGAVRIPLLGNVITQSVAPALWIIETLPIGPSDDELATEPLSLTPHSSQYTADLKSQGIPATREHLYQFLAHLEDAFLLQSIPVATDSEKRRQVNPRKVYPADPALIPVFDRSGKANTGHALESVVFTELQRRGAEIAYVKTASGFEVDFLARYPDGTEELIQVCASIDSSETRDREVRALQEATKEHPGARLTIFTLESRLPFPSVPEPINVMAAWAWMLE